MAERDNNNNTNNNINNCIAQNIQSSDALATTCWHKLFLSCCVNDCVEHDVADDQW